jgi:hypothetical protein
VSGRIINRRRHERFSLPPMYAAVIVEVLGPTGEPKHKFDGHCYDISEGGVQFELDDAIPSGTPIRLNIELPGALATDQQRRDVRVLGNVVWRDESEPGPVRMAAVFSRFAFSEDRERLFKHITSGKFSRAA